jgi:SpoVK/Ycf46/Vps4 family AAA+-type ATPase
MFAIHLKKRMYDPAGFDLDALAAASEGYTGAEIEQAVLSGMHLAFSRARKMGGDEVLQALRESPPLSATMKERVDGLRTWARGRCASAD